MAKDPTAEKARQGAVDANKWAPPAVNQPLAPVEDTIVLPPVKNNPFDDPPDTPPIATKAPEPERIAPPEPVAQTDTPDDPDLDVGDDEPDGAFDNLNIEVTEIDDVLDPHGVEAPVDTAEIEVGDGSHPCGLPMVLMNKELLVKYLKDHGVTKAHRDAIEYTEVERRLYEIYKTAKRGKRTVTKAFFTTGLRMYRHGMPLNIEKSLDLNKMKIGE